MQLDIHSDLFHRLNVRTAQGADALRELLDTVEWLEVDQPAPEQLAVSLKQIDQSIADIVAGRTLSIAEARTVSCAALSSSLL